MYTLLTTTPFRVPNNLGPLAIYYPPPIKILDINGAPVLNAAGQPTFVESTPIGRAKQATINMHFTCARNYWLPYMNKRHACYNILNDNIKDAFSMCPQSCHCRMECLQEKLREIFDQIKSTCGCPTPAALLQNDTLFRSMYSPQDAPKVLFRCIEDCQEIQILGENP
jgi:hypothetical protein